MIRILHTAAASLAVPIFAATVAAVPRYRPLLGRMAPKLPAIEDSPIWIHACSVGEINTAKPLLKGIAEAFPGVPVLLTTSTISGMKLAREMAPPIPSAWFPIDHPAAARRFLRKVRPRALVIIETELWPGIIDAAGRHGIPVLIANGRLSDKHMRNYRRLRAVYRWVLGNIAGVAAQDTTNAERFAELGMDSGRIHTAGNLKFDGAPPNPTSEERTALRDSFNLPAARPVVLFGSTRPGDEELAADSWKRVRIEFPRALLVVAPRHLERIGEAVAAFEGSVVMRRSTSPSVDDLEPVDVLLLDTHGELARAYGAADIAVIGGSFFPGVEGHNPIEAAAQGVPVIFGPHMRNFASPARQLLENNAAIQSDVTRLTDGIIELLGNHEKRREMGRQGAWTVDENRGVVKRHLDFFEGFLK